MPWLILLILFAVVNLYSLKILIVILLTVGYGKNPTYRKRGFFKLVTMGSYINSISCEINPLRFIIPLLIFNEKKKQKKQKQKKKPALYASLIVPCFTWLTCMYTFGYVCSNGCINSTVLWSYNTSGILAIFYYLFVLHGM